MPLPRESVRLLPPVAGKAAGEVRTQHRLQRQAHRRHLHLDTEASQRQHRLRTGLLKRQRPAARGTQMTIERLVEPMGVVINFL
jgi:hypothetical protein